LRVDDKVPGSRWSRNEAILHLNLTGKRNVRLQFDHLQSKDELQRYSKSQFTGHVNADLVAVSVDGSHWVKVTDLSGNFTGKVFALDTLLQLAGNAAGSTNRSDVRIKFQQYGSQPWGADGRALDNVKVTASGFPLPKAARGPAALLGEAGTLAQRSQGSGQLSAPDRRAVDRIDLWAAAAYQLDQIAGLNELSSLTGRFEGSGTRPGMRRPAGQLGLDALLESDAWRKF